MGSPVAGNTADTADAAVSAASTKLSSGFKAGPLFELSGFRYAGWRRVEVYARVKHPMVSNTRVETAGTGEDFAMLSAAWS